MGVDAKTLKTLFPEFSSEENKRINLFIDMAGRRVNTSVFGDKADDAVCLMASHLMTLANRKGKSGSITGEKVGDLSRNYSGGSSGDASSLGSTTYGQMFEDLMRSCRAVPRVLGCPNH